MSPLLIAQDDPIASAAPDDLIAYAWALASQPTAADAPGDGARSALAAQLKAFLAAERAAALAALDAGASAPVLAKRLAAAHDLALQAAFAFAERRAVDLKSAQDRLALVALGGFGRAEMAPFSDLDMLFLTNKAKPSPWSETLTETILYVLWDVGLKIGHAQRGLDESVRLARGDAQILTPLLEARAIAGDADLAATLFTRIEAETIAADAGAFLASKLAERDARHEKAGASRFLVEPNVKDGKGGLRDLQTIVWILRHAYGEAGIETLIKRGLLTAREVARLRLAERFMWQIRFWIHALRGRADERLTFDLQPEIARRLRFRDGGGLSSVERLMKRYFLAARDVGSLTRWACAALEQDFAKSPPRAFGDFVAKAMGRLPGGIVLRGGRLDFEAPEHERKPDRIMALFAAAALRGYDIHPAALSACARNLPVIDDASRGEPKTVQYFLSALTAQRAPGQSLRRMNEAGVLGRFLPEFGRIVGQTQFNMYHHFTVDEHTLNAIEVISDIDNGRCVKEHPLASSFIHSIRNRRALFLAMLLHDVGKGKGDQQAEGARAARAACLRLGLPEDEADLVAWLVGRHLLMSDTAQKRDLGDPATITTFAREVGSIERLRMLVVITIADIRAVGPGIWNGWKGQLLRDLFRLTEAALRGGRTDSGEIAQILDDRARAARRALRAQVSNETAARLRAEFGNSETAYWLAFDAAAHVWHAREADSMLMMGRSAHAAVRPNKVQGVTELLAVARDRPGLFATLTATLAGAGANIVSAHIFTTKTGWAVDLFRLHDPTGAPFAETDPLRLERLRSQIERVCAGLEEAPARISDAPESRRAQAFRLRAWAVADQEASAESTVIEVSGRDRPGLLSELAAALTRSGVTIQSAHIGGYGARANDVFYVQELFGGKLADPARCDEVCARLEAVFNHSETGLAAAPRRHKFARADASDLR